MNVAAGPRLAAAVTNAGGIGVIGGIRQSPKMLQDSITELKSHLEDQNAPFGVDLLIPQIGGNARKTNHDYTKGQLPELTDVIIRNKATLFVCAVGVPPKEMVDKLHSAGIVVMKYGASGVWVGTRFVASEEAGAPPRHKELVVSAGYDDTVRTLIYSGRPMSVRKTPYVAGWDNRHQEVLELTSQGKIPHEVELEKHPEKSLEGRMWLMGKVAGSINDIKPAKAM
ncbi:hypothetical protein PHLCEN_2v13003 [Hermanssonia centrifuga]|uniref:Uncharacterized protein n=1 Tax=Hermanssonia centrifuga TaxID=98765 RepID=A0A2R6NFJ1_9APHY|nr:hypothetical protein PHLCEN_2v13003 [Hermanssonia centrifuga]